MSAKEISSKALINIITKINPSAQIWLEDDPKVNLLESNAIDSINVVKIIRQLEKKFDFLFDAVDIKVENFESVDSLLNLLSTKYQFKILNSP